MISAANFGKFSNLVIDNLEGGYYHPRLFYSINDPRYSTSGETMFGIDRKNAGKLIDTPAGREFWRIIDQNSANWKWNFFGGPVEDRLRELAAEIIYPAFVRYSNMWLTPASREAIQRDDRLLLNFIYATWNGPGWFKKFASDFNKISGSSIENQINQTINSRTKEGLRPGSRPNSLIKQTGDKLSRIYKSISTPLNIDAGKGLAGIILAASFIVSLFLIAKSYGKF